MGEDVCNDSKLSLSASPYCGTVYTTVDVDPGCWSEIVESFKINGTFD